MKPINNNYYIRINERFELVKGKKVVLDLPWADELDLFIHKDNEKYFCISEARSGTFIASSKKKIEAIEYATNKFKNYYSYKLDQGKVPLDEINGWINSYKMSPRYEEPADQKERK